MDVLITHPLPLSEILLKKAGLKVKIQRQKTPLTKKQLLKEVRGVRALLPLLFDRIDVSVMDAAGPSLKIIANFAVGYDNIDLAAAYERGIVITNTPCQEVSDAVAEHTVALMLALLRRVVEADSFVRSGKFRGWNPDLLIGSHPSGKTLGLVGLGRIGKRVAQYAASSFGMRVLYYDVIRDRDFEKKFGAAYAPFEKVLRHADIVSLHVPLLSSTRHLISGKTLRLMKKDALLINTARGPVIDQRAVLSALQKKKLGGFALDVFECEPAVMCSATDVKALCTLSNVIMTPHISSATVQARSAMMRLAAENIIAVLSGKKALSAIK